MKSQKNKLMNFRIILFVAVTMIISSILAVKVFVTQNARLIVFTSIFVLSLSTIICFIKFKKRFLCIIFTLLFSAFIPTLSIFIKAEIINKNNFVNVEKCYISGKIYKINEKLDENKIDVYLTNVQVKSEEETKNYHGSYLIVIRTDNVKLSSIEVGKTLTHYGELGSFSLNSNNSKDISYISRGIYGRSYAYSYTYSISEEKSLNLREKVKLKVYSLFEKTDLYYTGVGYAMLFGESSVVDDEVYSVFKSTGIVHLLAVSGFHVSIIVGCLSFILEKLKASKKTKIIVTQIILGFYAYLCDFSVSVIRASIMAMVLLWAESRNKEYDKLNSLSLSACLILLINPLDVFNISFVLSFVVVFSITLIMPLLERLFGKIFYSKFSSSLSLSLASSIGISVFQLYYFKNLPILSFIANMITVPLMSILCVYLIISVLICLIFSFATPLIELFGYMMKYILQINKWISEIGLYVKLSSINVFALLISLILIWQVSDCVFVKRKTKVISASVLSAILVVLMII